MSVKSRRGKRLRKRPDVIGSGERREDEHVRTTADASKASMTASEPGQIRDLGRRHAFACRPGDGPVGGPGGARCIGGVSSSQALVWNRRTCRPDTDGQSKWVLDASWLREEDPRPADTGRGRVPMRGTGADRLVVVKKAL
jgi:hypothetical protein